MTLNTTPDDLNLLDLSENRLKLIAPKMGLKCFLISPELAHADYIWIEPVCREGIRYAAPAGGGEDGPAIRRSWKARHSSESSLALTEAGLIFSGPSWRLKQAGAKARPGKSQGPLEWDEIARAWRAWAR